MTLELPPGQSRADDLLPQDSGNDLAAPDPAADPFAVNPDSGASSSAPADPLATKDTTAANSNAASMPVSPNPADASFANPQPPSPPDAPPAPPSPAALALDNARRGHWVMTDDFDGWVLLGGDGKPVRRADRSRVIFRFRDAARLAEELAASSDDTDPVPLAPLDSGTNRDWDPHALAARLDTRTKMIKLLAYRYARFTEPEEAVRRAVSDLFGDPTLVEEPSIYAWVPGRFDLDAVKATAAALLRRAAGPQPEGEDGGTAYSGIVPFGALMRGGVPRDGSGRDASIMKAAATSGSPTSPAADLQLAQVGAATPEPGTRTIPGDNEPPREHRNGVIRNLPLSPRQQQTQDTSRALSRYRYSPFDGALAQKESGGNPNEGYGTYVFGEGAFAYGRYQMRPGALQDTKMIDGQGRWTGKFGVRSWQEFLENPQAQEAAFKEWKGLLETSVQTHHMQRLGKTITGIKDDIRVTRSGLVAAMHKQGRVGVIRYLQWLESKGWNSRDHKHEMPPGKLGDSFLAIETRLREFQDVEY